MDPLSGGLLALGVGAGMAGINFSGSALDAAVQYHYAKKMYQHRYRWAVKDLQKAGLNPILAAGGASTGGMSAAPSTDFQGGLQNAASTALSAAKAVSDINSQAVANDKTRTDQQLSQMQAQNVQSKTINQQLQNSVLSKSEKALIEDAQARSATNTAMAQLQSARAAHARELADAERDLSQAKSHTEAWRGVNESSRNVIMTGSPEFNMSSSERAEIFRKIKAAEILQKQMAPFWQGVNSASRVFGGFK